MDYTNSLPAISLPLDVIISLVFLLTLGAYIIFTAVLYYHWQAYSPNTRTRYITGVVYITTTLPLLVSMGLITLFI